MLHYNLLHNSNLELPAFSKEFLNQCKRSFKIRRHVVRNIERFVKKLRYETQEEPLKNFNRDNVFAKKKIESRLSDCGKM